MRTIINFLHAIWVYIVFSIKGKPSELFKTLNEELEEVQIDQAMQSIVDKKFNKIGSSTKKGNCPMWSFNLDTDKVEKVPMIRQESGNYRGFMNPNHPHVWAINKKNAIRKFKKQGYMPFKDV